MRLTKEKVLNDISLLENNISRLYSRRKTYGSSAPVDNKAQHKIDAAITSERFMISRLLVVLKEVENEI